MIRVSTILLSTSLLFIGLSCKSTQLKSASNVELEQRVNQFIICLNSYDEDCLSEFFHRDYKSIAPGTKEKKVASLIKNTVENFAKNQLKVFHSIHEIKPGIQQSYVIMDWIIIDKNANDRARPLVAYQRIDIWVKEQKNWQLYRTILYKPLSF